ncbi:unnamed protein product, partial [Menidia menidia]
KQYLKNVSAQRDCFHSHFIQRLTRFPPWPQIPSLRGKQTELCSVSSLCPIKLQLPGGSDHPILIRRSGHGARDYQKPPVPPTQGLRGREESRVNVLVTAVRLPDGLSFVIYEFWDGEEEWKSGLVQREQRLSMKTLNYTPRLLDTPLFFTPPPLPSDLPLPPQPSHPSPLFPSPAPPGRSAPAEQTTPLSRIRCQIDMQTQEKQKREPLTTVHLVPTSPGRDLRAPEWPQSDPGVARDLHRRPGDK